VIDSPRNLPEHPPDENREPVPAGVRAVAALYTLCAIYLALGGMLMLARPGVIPMSAAAPLLFGLELAGPYMFFLMTLAGVAVAWGLMKRNNITRHIAMLIAITGIVMLVPSVSDAAAMVDVRALAAGGLGIVVRVIVAWYLGRAEVADQFRRLN